MKVHIEFEELAEEARSLGLELTRDGITYTLYDDKAQEIIDSPSLGALHFWLLGYRKGLYTGAKISIEGFKEIIQKL